MLKLISADNASSAFNQFACRFVNTIARAQHALNTHQDIHSIDAIDKLYIDYCQKTLPELDQNAMAKVVEIENNINPKNIPRHLQGRPNRVVALEEYFNDHPSTDDVLLGLRSAIQYDKTYFDKIVASLLPLLEKLGTGKTAEIISPDYIPVAASVDE